MRFKFFYYRAFITVFCIAMSVFLLTYSQNVQVLNNECTVTLKCVHPDEAAKIKNDVTRFYAQELFKSGCCPSESEALKAAKKEINEDSDSKQKTFAVVSSECSKSLGYICYSAEISKKFIPIKKAYIEALFIKEEYRKQGIANQALRALEIKLQSKCYDSIALYVFVHNVAACKLYTNLGYTVKQAYKVNGKTVGCRMEKKLRR